MALKIDRFLTALDNNQIRRVTNQDCTLSLFEYLSGLSDWSKPELRQARGIVYDHSTGELIVKPFDKFFNYHQYEWVTKELNEESMLALSNVKKENRQYLADLTMWPKQFDEVRVYDKLDGSMMNVSLYKNELLCTSSGSIDGNYPKMFTKTLENHLGDKLDEFKSELANYTLTFEFINPALDQHVVQYDFKDIVLIGGYDKEQQIDLEFTNQLDKFATQFNFRQPHYYSDVHSEQDMLNLMDKLEQSDQVIEGCVAVFLLNDGGVMRLKFKTPLYLKLHDTMSSITYSAYTFKSAKNIYQMLENDELDDYLNRFDLNEDNLIAISTYKQLFNQHYAIKQAIINYISNYEGDFDIDMHSKKRKHIIEEINEQYGTLGQALISRYEKDNISKIVLSKHYKIELIINKELKQSVKDAKEKAMKGGIIK